ncbi:MAG: hypothetical protein ACXQTM_01580 [Methanosarcinales archaeon]
MIIVIVIINMSVLGECAEDILLGLKDSERVSLKEIEEEVRLPAEKTKLLLDFLSYSRFITVDERIGDVRLDHFGELLIEI